MKFHERIYRRLALPGAASYIEPLGKTGGCRTALDIGCGSSSTLTIFRPPLVTLGMDAFPVAIDAAKARGVHDHYILGDVPKDPLEDALERFGGKVDLVTLFSVIEHLPKHAGYQFLDACEKLTGKCVLLETPNGFLPRGPEYGNQRQRRLSD